MTYTDDDLRSLLRERSERGPTRGPDVTEIRRQGAWLKAYRWVMGTMGLVVAGTAVLLLWPDAAPAPRTSQVAAAPASSMDPVLGDLPYLDERGAIDAISMGGSAVGEDLTATGERVRVRVVCKEPRAWVVASGRGEGSVGRCGDGVWTTVIGGSPGKVRVWVFPPDAAITEADPRACTIYDADAGTCDGRYRAADLLRYDVALELAADLGAKPGSWRAGVYGDA